MAGVNLSQSMASRDEKSNKRSLFASSFPISIILLVLTLAGWGGLRWYLHTLDQKITELDTTIASKSDKLQGNEVDRVADFDSRLSLLGAALTEQVDTRDVLTRLEALIVPQVVLTRYEYDQKGMMSTITGETENFRYLAGQIVSLKSDPLFAQTVVDKIERTQKGKIQFTLKANF